MMKMFVLAIAGVASLTACSGNDSTDNSTEITQQNLNATTADESSGNSQDNSAEDVVDTSQSNQSTVTMATYRATFNATWSEVTHPLNFPSNPHFSGLVGAVHSEQVEFWMNGQPATGGIKLMAETGGKSLLLSEVADAIGNGYASAEISGAGVGTSPGSVSVEFRVSADYPQVTLVSMVAPSPDWFVGVHNLSLLENGMFVPSRTVDLVVYDAGTDSGRQYTSRDLPTVPQEPIQVLNSAAPDAPFTNGLPALGQLVFDRLP